jgi:crotonobetainyl-CoA:carnitine CoA-transferase CaiB-like acyl-CoA transferase
MTSLNGALAGLCVLDFSQVGAGPTIGTLLGDLGADVIKIEAPSGDIGRKLGPPFQSGESVTAMSFNRSKRSLVIDLKAPEGPEVVKRLAAKADILIESFRPGVMDRLGVGWSVLSALRPELIFCSVSAYGQTGPWSGKPGVDGIVQAVSGLMSLIGSEGAPPTKVQSPVVDMATGFLGTVAVLAALQKRNLCGQGQHLDVSLYASAMMLQQSAIASFLSSGERPARIGSAAPYSAPNEAYPTRDGWIMIAAYHPDRWTAFCEVLEAPEMAADPDFATSPLRVAHRGKLMEAISARLASRTTAEWQEALEARDIICGPINEYDAVVASPQLAHLGAIVELDHPRAGRVRMPGSVLGDRNAQSRATRPPPLVGEHSEEILAQFGFSPEEIGRLRDARAVVQLEADPIPG